MFNEIEADENLNQCEYNYKEKKIKMQSEFRTLLEQMTNNNIDTIDKSFHKSNEILITKLKELLYIKDSKMSYTILSKKHNELFDLFEDTFLVTFQDWLRKDSDFLEAEIRFGDFGEQNNFYHRKEGEDICVCTQPKFRKVEAIYEDIERLIMEVITINELFKKWYELIKSQIVSEIESQSDDADKNTVVRIYVDGIRFVEVKQDESYNYNYNMEIKIGVLVA